MQQQTLDGHHGRSLSIDLCESCQLLWFDGHESLQLSPGATLSLFRLIGERAARPSPGGLDRQQCPRCAMPLRSTHDVQRTTRFQYLRCPAGHGRLISFVEFLKEKDVIRPLTPQQIAQLRRSVRSVSCSQCGAPIALAQGTVCAHCGSSLSMLDLEHTGRVIAQLRRAAAPDAPVDPALPLELARARREVEQAFAGAPARQSWLADASGSGLVAAALHLVSRLLTK